MGFLGDIFGGKYEEADRSAEQSVDRAEGKSRAIRSALLKTEGGILGEELEEGDIKKRRKTLFGNA